MTTWPRFASCASRCSPKNATRRAHAVDQAICRIRSAAMSKGCPTFCPTCPTFAWLEAACVQDSQPVQPIRAHMRARTHHLLVFSRVGWTGRAKPDRTWAAAAQPQCLTSRLHGHASAGAAPKTMRPPERRAIAGPPWPATLRCATPRKNASHWLGQSLASLAIMLHQAGAVSVAGPLNATASAGRHLARIFWWCLWIKNQQGLARALWSNFAWPS